MLERESLLLLNPASILSLPLLPFAIGCLSLHQSLVTSRPAYFEFYFVCHFIPILKDTDITLPFQYLFLVFFVRLLSLLLVQNVTFYIKTLKVGYGLLKKSLHDCK